MSGIICMMVAKKICQSPEESGTLQPSVAIKRTDYGLAPLYGDIAALA